MEFVSDNNNLNIYKAPSGKLRYETNFEPDGYLSEDEGKKICKLFDSFYHLSIFTRPPPHNCSMAEDILSLIWKRLKEGSIQKDPACNDEQDPMPIQDMLSEYFEEPYL